MKTIIAGSRNINDYKLLQKVIAALPRWWHITEVVSGTAHGVDRLGERWAYENGITVIKFPANWIKYGKSAGPRRNLEMGRYVAPNGGLIALWDGTSSGTSNMIEVAHTVGIKIHLYKL